MNFQHIFEVAIGFVVGYFIIRDLQKKEASYLNGLLKLFGAGVGLVLMLSVFLLIVVGILYLIAWGTNHSDPLRGFLTNLQVYLLIGGLCLFDFIVVSVLEKVSKAKLKSKNGFWASGITSFIAMYFVMLLLIIVGVLLNLVFPILGEREFQDKFGINPFILVTIISIIWAMLRHFFVRFGVKSKLFITEIPFAK